MIRFIFFPKETVNKEKCFEIMPSPQDAQSLKCMNPQEPWEAASQPRCQMHTELGGEGKGWAVSMDTVNEC